MSMLILTANLVIHKYIVIRLKTHIHAEDVQRHTFVIDAMNDLFLLADFFLITHLKVNMRCALSVDKYFCQRQSYYIIHSLLIIEIK